MFPLGVPLAPPTLPTTCPCHLHGSGILQYEEVAEKDDLMGVEDTAKKDILCLVGGGGVPSFAPLWVEQHWNWGRRVTVWGPP